MWPFSKKLSKSDSIEHKCECNSKVDSSCKIISPEELRKIANDGRIVRVNEALDKIKSDLKLNAEYCEIKPVNIRFKLELETEVLNALAECGLKVDLTSRDVYTGDLYELGVSEYHLFKDSVTYNVSF